MFAENITVNFPNKSVSESAFVACSTINYTLIRIANETKFTY